MSKSIQELEQYVCTLYDTRDQLKNHIFERADRAFATGDSARDLIVNELQLKEEQEVKKQAFLTAIGGLPSSESPLNPRTVKIVQAEGYLVENVIFESRPKHYVTANLYLPEQRVQARAAVLFLCGHEYEGKHSSYYHQVCLRFVQAGLIVLAIDPIGQGERLSFLSGADRAPLWGTAEHQRLGVQSYAIGESVARYFLHDAMRAIDYLQSRPEVDPARIGVTGNSGGGTQTAMLMVCDERLAAAAPGTFIMNRQQYMHAGGVQDAEQVWPGLSAQGFDHEDLLLCFAPKPLLVLAVQYDFFPIEATRRTVQRCRRFWQMLNHPDRIALVEDASTHRYTDRLAIAAANFFSKELMGKASPVSERERPLKPLQAKQLLCTPSGQVLTSFSDARTVQDENCLRSQELRRMRLSMPPTERVQRTREWLTAQVIGPRERCDFNTRLLSLGEVEGLSVDYLLWWSQKNLMNSAYFLRACESSPMAPQSVVIGLWPGGTTALQEHWSWIQAMCERGRTVFVLNCSGVGPHEPYTIYGKPAHLFFGVIHKLTDDLLWLGDSLAALRTYDLMRSVELLFATQQLIGEKIELYAVGLFEIYAVLASILDKRIVHLTSETAITSISEELFGRFFAEEDIMSVVFPEVLKYLDLTEWKGSLST